MGRSLMTLMASGLGGFGLYTEIIGTSACIFMNEISFQNNIFIIQIFFFKYKTSPLMIINNSVKFV